MEKSKLNKNKIKEWKGEKTTAPNEYMGSQTLIYIFFSYSFPIINIYCFLPN